MNDKKHKRKMRKASNYQKCINTYTSTKNSTRITYYNSNQIKRFYTRCKNKVIAFNDKLIYNDFSEDYESDIEHLYIYAIRLDFVYQVRVYNGYYTLYVVNDEKYKQHIEQLYAPLNELPKELSDIVYSQL